MRNQLNHHIFVCLLCVTLLFAIGMGIEHRISKQTETTPIPSVQTGYQTQVTDDDKPSIDIPETDNLTYAHLKSIEPSPQPVPAPPVKKQNVEASYEVTADYLNVRSEADGTSKILDVVTKGSILEVVRPTDNGWLELKSGGYVHGGYAMPIGGGAKPSASGQAPRPAGPSAKPSKPTSAVKSSSGLTEEQIAKMIKNTALEGEGLEKAILETEKTYGINSYFTIAVMKLESGHGKSQLAKTKNNLFGLNAIDGDSYNNALSFKTKGESVIEFGHIISEFYLDKGLTSVEKVARKYCEANSDWPALVKSIMNSDYKKIA